MIRLVPLTIDSSRRFCSCRSIFDTATQADVFSAAAQIVLFVQAMKIGGQIRVVILLILIVT